MATQGTFDFGPDAPRSGVALQRDFHGFAQLREDEHRPWVFYVCGCVSTTSGEAGQCTVLRADGGREFVPSDAQDRIPIAGRQFCGVKHRQDELAQRRIALGNIMKARASYKTSALRSCGRKCTLTARARAKMPLPTCRTAGVFDFP